MLMSLIIAFTQSVLKNAQAYTDQSVAALLNGLQYRGAVNYVSDLENAVKKIGFVYTVKYQGSSGTEPDGTEYVWGEYEDVLQWIPLGPSILQKADKVKNGTSGNFAALDSTGNITDSGKKASDFYTSADRGVANGLAGLDENGRVPSNQLPVSASFSNGEMKIITEIS